MGKPRSRPIRRGDTATFYHYVVLGYRDERETPIPVRVLNMDHPCVYGEVDPLHRAHVTVLNLATGRSTAVQSAHLEPA